jgi:hypothetical protein
MTRPLFLLVSIGASSCLSATAAVPPGDVKVMFAARDILAGELVRAEDIVERSMPAELSPSARSSPRRRATSLISRFCCPS